MGTKIEQAKDIGTLGRGTGLASFGVFCHKFAAFLLLALQVRYLGVDKYGAFSIAFGISMLLAVPQRLGLMNGLSRFCVQARIDKDASRLWAAFWLGVVVPFALGILMGLGWWACSAAMNNRFYQSSQVLEAFIAFSIALPILGIADMPAVLTTSFETNRYAVLSRDILGLATEIGVLALLLMMPASISPQNNISAVVFAKVMGQLMYFGVGSYGFYTLCKQRKLLLVSTKGHLSILKKESAFCFKIIRYCVPLLMGGGFQRIVQWTDTIMIGTFLDTFSAGAYRIAVQLATFIASILHAIGSIFGPLTAKYHHRKQLDHLAQLYHQAARVTLIIAFPFIMVLLVFPVSFLTIFDDQASIAALALQLLVLGQAYNLFTGNVGIVLTMAGKPHWHAINGAIVAGLHVVFCFFLIPRFGMVGAAGATVFAVFFLNSLRVFEINKFFHFHCMDKTVFQTFIPAAAALLVLVVYRLLLRTHLEHQWLIVISATLLSCFVSWGLHGRYLLNEGDRYFISGIVNRIFKKKISVKANNVE